MSVQAKHIATFLLGAAAGLAAAKYMRMTPEEKQQLADDIKDKAISSKQKQRTLLTKPGIILRSCVLKVARP